MTDETSHGPKVFVSYSWTSEEHVEWVVDLAERLMTDGVRAVLDKWDLNEGQDKYVFMEKMVQDDTIDRVLIISDAEYTRKANAREGGVGTESQIILPTIYDEEDQEKFIPLVTELDSTGRALKPTYLEGRIHLDFSQPQSFEQEYEKLLRNIFGKPVHPRPPIGEPPSYITQDEPIRLRTSAKARTFRAAVQNSRPHVRGAFRDYTDALHGALSEVRISSEDAESIDHLDDLVVERIEVWEPYAREFVDLTRFVIRYEPYAEIHDDIHSFFESALPLKNRPPNASQWRDRWSDPTAFLIRELFQLTGLTCLEERAFAMWANLLDRPYFMPDWRGAGGDYHHFSVFDAYVRTLDRDRNARLQLQRRSVAADFIKERAERFGYSFKAALNASLVLFTRSVLDQFCHDRTDSGNLRFANYWYPRLVVFWGRHGSLEITQRLQSRSFFDDFKCVLGVESLDNLRLCISAIEPGPEIVREGFVRLEARAVASLLGVEEIGSVA